MLPPLDDELAQAATEFETLAELRADVEARLGEQLEAELDAQFRENAVDALVDASTFEGIEPLVDRRANSLLAGFVRTLEQRGSAGEYLHDDRADPRSSPAEHAAEAERAVKRELVLEALADEKGLDVSDEEVDELIRARRRRPGGSRRGDRSDARTRRLRAAARRPPPAQGARRGRRRGEADSGRAREAREKLWTPEKEKGGSRY